MITIYGAEWCGWCIKAKELAENRNLPYTWKNAEDPILYDEMKVLAPQSSTIPQIFWDERYIGGYSEFAMEIENTIGGYGDGKI